MKIFCILIFFSFLFCGALNSFAADSSFSLWQKVDTKDFKEIQDRVEQHFMGKFKGRGSGYKQYKRWEFIMQNRILPDGTIVNRTAKTWLEWQDYLDKKGDALSSNGSWYSLLRQRRRRFQILRPGGKLDRHLRNTR